MMIDSFLDSCEVVVEKEGDRAQASREKNLKTNKKEFQFPSNDNTITNHGRHNRCKDPHSF